MILIILNEILSPLESSCHDLMFDSFYFNTSFRFLFKSCYFRYCWFSAHWINLIAWSRLLKLNFKAVQLILFILIFILLCWNTFVFFFFEITFLFLYIYMAGFGCCDVLFLRQSSYIWKTGNRFLFIYILIHLQLFVTFFFFFCFLSFAFICFSLIPSLFLMYFFFMRFERRIESFSRFRF